MKNPDIYYWTHMLDESFNKHMLNEGKHWPEDYLKTAFNTIKNSPLGQTSWYSDEFIKKDLQTFLNAFTSLAHKNSNLGYFMTIVRWFLEYVGNDLKKYHEFIEQKVGDIIATLMKVSANKDYDI